MSSAIIAGVMLFESTHFGSHDNDQCATAAPHPHRYPIYLSKSYGRGYWIANVRSSMAVWSMMAHVDLGTRSDTGRSNRSPLTTMLPIVRYAALRAGRLLLHGANVGLSPGSVLQGAQELPTDLQHADLRP